MPGGRVGHRKANTASGVARHSKRANLWAEGNNARSGVPPIVVFEPDADLRHPEALLPQSARSCHCSSLKMALSNIRSTLHCRYAANLAR